MPGCERKHQVLCENRLNLGQVRLELLEDFRVRTLMKPLRLTTYLQCRRATSMLGVILVVVHDTARTKRFVITRRYGCPLNQWVYSSLCHIPRLSLISRGLSEVTAQVCREGWAPKSESIRCWDWVHATTTSKGKTEQLPSEHSFLQPYNATTTALLRIKNLQIEVSAI